MPAPRPAEIRGATSAERGGFLADELSRVDPKKDGWDTEAFHDEIKPVFSRLMKQFGKRDVSQVKEIAPLVAPNFRCGPLRPGNLREDFREAQFVVRRAAGPSPAPKPADIAAEAAKMLAPYEAGKEVDIHIKIFQVSLDGLAGTATAYVDAFGTPNVQQNSTWHTKWMKQDARAPWQLAEVTVADFEEVEFRGPAPKLFSDCSEAVLGDTQTWSDHLLYGIDHWRLRIEYNLGIESSGLNGLAIGDADGNGLDDVFYCDSGGLPKRLFLHQPDGKVRDATIEAGLDLLDRSRSALFVDFDNDLDQDLVVAREDNIALFANDGKARFTLVGAFPSERRIHSLAAADYDLDGRVDVYVCAYGSDFTSFGEDGVPTPWFDANNGARNSLFRNEGGWKFRDVTVETGLDQNNRKFSLAAAWEDYNNDGYPDLCVANDFGRNNLYQNDQGRFTDVAARAGAEDISPGMACDWGDVNGDGHFDIHVSNMFSGAGNRIAYQPRYKAGSSLEVLAGHRRFARGNTLLINQGNGTFADMSEECAIILGRWAWGSHFADINNDGWQDILVGNGFTTGPEPDDL